jgi:hypothetical protein
MLDYNARPRYVRARTGRAFSCDGPNSGYRARIHADGTVEVYDSLAGHYTTCHSLTAAQIRYVRRAAVYITPA